MKKRLLFVLLVVILAMAACGQKPAAPPGLNRRTRLNRRARHNR